MATSRLSIWLHIYLASVYSGLACAGLLHWRQDTDQTTSDAATPSTILAATGPSATAVSASTSSGEIESSATPLSASSAVTSTSDKTAVSVSTGSAAAAAAAAATSGLSNSLNDTNDPHECHIVLPDEGIKNPFCKPSMGQTVIVDKDFKVTWDPTLFDSNTNDTLTFDYVDNSKPTTTANISAVHTLETLNAPGEAILSLPSSILSSNTTLNLTLTLKNPSHEDDLSGPWILLSKSNSTSSSSSSKSKKLGEEVGIPLGLVFLIAGVGLLALFFYMRKRRSPGPGGKSARSQRMAAAVTNPGARGHRRDPSFHDEPTRGMELQNRNVKSGGGEDNWDWGSPVSSPTTTTITGGSSGGNAFREEMRRQRSGKAV